MAKIVWRMCVSLLRCLNFKRIVVKVSVGWNDDAWIQINFYWSACVSHWPCIMSALTHWGQVMHVCISKWTTIGWENGLSPEQHQAIIWTNAEILLIGPLGTNFSKILIEIDAYIFIQENAFENVVWEMAAVLFQPRCVNGSSCGSVSNEWW